MRYYTVQSNAKWTALYCSLNNAFLLVLIRPCCVISQLGKLVSTVFLRQLKMTSSNSKPNLNNTVLQWRCPDYFSFSFPKSLLVTIQLKAMGCFCVLINLVGFSRREMFWEFLKSLRLRFFLAITNTTTNTKTTSTRSPNTRPQMSPKFVFFSSILLSGLLLCDRQSGLCCGGLDGHFSWNGKKKRQSSVHILLSFPNIG